LLATLRRIRDILEISRENPYESNAAVVALSLVWEAFDDFSSPMVRCSNGLIAHLKQRIWRDFIK
jgi:hypothetical protein